MTDLPKKVEIFNMKWNDSSKRDDVYFQHWNNRITVQTTSWSLKNYLNQIKHCKKFKCVWGNKFLTKYWNKINRINILACFT